MRTAEGGIRNHLQIAPGRDVLQAGHLAELRHEARYLLGNIRPEGILVIGRDAAEQPETPGLHGLGGKAQAAEGNRHHGDVSLGCEPALRIPEGVEAEIVALAFGLDRGIGLNAEGIDEEFVAALAGVVGIEEDADQVVAQDVLALGHAGARLAGRRVADENRVEVLIVVADPGGSLAADGHAVAGLALAEIVHALHVGARRAAEELLDSRRAGQLGDLNIFDLGGRWRWRRGLCMQGHNECAQAQRGPPAEPSIALYARLAVRLPKPACYNRGK